METITVRCPQFRCPDMYNIKRVSMNRLLYTCKSCGCTFEVTVGYSTGIVQPM